jgi:hypothetical protein
MKNISGKSLYKNSKTLFIFNNFSPENRVVTDKTTDGNMAHTHCMLDAEKLQTLSQNVTHCFFPPQQWLYERASTLRSSYIACHVSHIAESSVTST